MRIKEILAELDFFGRRCTKDCSGHRAGWEWERKHKTNTKQGTPSSSFNNGTEIAIDQRKANKQPVGPQIRGAKGRFQKFQLGVKEDQNLEELTGVKQFQNYTLPQLIGILADEYKFKILGGGALGTVLQGPDPNFVYKVVEKDDAYLSFVNFAMKHPNVHYPRFFKVKPLTAFYARYKIQPNKFTVIKLEKLQPLPEGTGSFVSQLSEVRRLETATPTNLPNGRTNYEDLSFYELAETRPWIVTLWNAIRAVQKSRAMKGEHDFHPGNFMQRQDGTVVITDPVKDMEVFGMQSRVNTMLSHNIKPERVGPVYKKKSTKR